MRVSVVVPCHNAERCLAEALTSALEQSRPPDEVIVVDDGSTDGSLETARGFEPRVRVVTQENQGAPAARNRGYALASGDAIMFLDADDVLGPDALRALVEALDEHPGAIAACPWYRLERVDGEWVRAPASCYPRRPGDDPLEGWLRRWYHPPCSVLWSRGAYERTGGWDPRALVNNDGDIMMRALADGTRLVITAEGSAYYRRAPDDETSVSGARFSREGRASQIYVIDKVARRLEAHGTIERYRPAIGDAFALLAEECGDDFPDLRKQCAELARRYDRPLWVRSARRRGRRIVRRVLRKVAGS